MLKQEDYHKREEITARRHNSKFPDYDLSVATLHCECSLRPVLMLLLFEFSAEVPGILRVHDVSHVKTNDTHFYFKFQSILLY